MYDYINSFPSLAPQIFPQSLSHTCLFSSLLSLLSGMRLFPFSYSLSSWGAVFGQTTIWMRVFFRSLPVHSWTPGHFCHSCLEGQDSLDAAVGSNHRCCVVYFAAESLGILSSRCQLDLCTNLKCKWMWLHFSSSWLHHKTQCIAARPGSSVEIQWGSRSANAEVRLTGMRLPQQQLPVLQIRLLLAEVTQLFWVIRIISL